MNDENCIAQTQSHMGRVSSSTVTDEHMVWTLRSSLSNVISLLDPIMKTVLFFSASFPKEKI